MNIDQLNHYQRKLAYEMDSWDLYVALGENEPIIVVDGRSAEAYAQEHIPGALNLPPPGNLLQFHGVARQIKALCLLLRRHRLQRLDEDGTETADAGLPSARINRRTRLVEARRLRYRWR